MANIGVLALQGDFLEHESTLRRLGADVRQVRKPNELTGLDGLVIPGGESTTFSRLIQDFDLFEPLQGFLHSGAPTWGTCAGLIMLAERVDNLKFPTFGVLDVGVRRNGFGRQVDSFESDIAVPALGPEAYHAVFIRAPVISDVGGSVEVLARLAAGDGESVVAVRQGNFLGTSFHPELTQDARFHQYFLDMVARAGSTSDV